MNSGIARGLAIFLGGFSLLNVIGGLLDPHFDASIWWIDFRPLPVFLSRLLLLAASLLILSGAVRPRMGPRRTVLTRAAVSLLMLVVLVNCLQYYYLLFTGEISTDFPFPFSILILVILIGIFPGPAAGRPDSIGGSLRRMRGDKPAGVRERQAIILSLAACILIFPISQILSFGRTDYRRPAQAIVVFGARAYANGKPSRALADRTRTAVDLYKQGFADHLVFSGGPGDGDIHETEAMKRFAVKNGVPAGRIQEDLQGLNTRATVANTVPYFRQKRLRRVLAVSHYFHLPRIKMAYQRSGFDVLTVPAEESKILLQTPYLLFRETAALWYYYLRPLFGSSTAPADSPDAKTAGKP